MLTPRWVGKGIAQCIPAQRCSLTGVPFSPVIYPTNYFSPNCSGQSIWRTAKILKRRANNIEARPLRLRQRRSRRHEWRGLRVYPGRACRGATAGALRDHKWQPPPLAPCAGGLFEGGHPPRTSIMLYWFVRAFAPRRPKGRRPAQC